MSQKLLAKDIEKKIRIAIMLRHTEMNLQGKLYIEFHLLTKMYIACVLLGNIDFATNQTWNIYFLSFIPHGIY